MRLLSQFMKAMSEDQIMQVVSDAFVANYAGASCLQCQALQACYPSGQLQ